MGDLVEQLPTDQTDITHQEKYILDSIFSKNINTLSTIAQEMKEAVLAGILYAIFSLPMIDSLIQKFIKITENSPIILMAVKVILFIVLFYVLKNFGLSRK